MEGNLIGREEEARILNKALTSSGSNMIAVIGRRRVGKTYLIRQVYSNKIDFELTGIQNASLTEQLSNFSYQLNQVKRSSKQQPNPCNWMDAFQSLIKHLNTKRVKRKKIVFIDELPWLSSRKSGFLKALSFFWNSWAEQNNTIVVICGSAASWMIQNVIYHKGGLHNRVTERIHLHPFNLYETKSFLRRKKINLNDYQIIQLYMAMGGIPHYLKEIEGGKSATENIEQICFSSNGLLRDEFQKLYPALFEKSENHILVIRALAKKWKGLTRQEIIEATKLPTGGGTTRIIDELIASGFASSYIPFNKKKKDTLYRLTDEYSLFYIHFIEPRKSFEKGIWMQLSQTSKYKSWRGYAFESLCLRHIDQIKKALNISGIYSQSSSFASKGTKSKAGTQIDLLIDRNDQVINICELKFYHTEFSISKSYAQTLRNKLETFRLASKTKKQLLLTLVTTYGLDSNEHSLGLVDNHLSMKVLFENS